MSHTPLQHVMSVARQIHDGAHRHGFWPRRSMEVGHDVMCSCHGGVRNFGEMIALCHSELSEALETFRKDPERMDEHCPEFRSLDIELADTVIRLLDTAYAMRIDLEAAIHAKMAYNDGRPHKHGKSF